MVRLAKLRGGARVRVEGSAVALDPAGADDTRTLVDGEGRPRSERGIVDIWVVHQSEANRVCLVICQHSAIARERHTEEPRCIGVAIDDEVRAI